MRCRWTMWEFLDGENHMNDDLMWNLTRHGWGIKDMLNEICMVDWIIDEINYIGYGKGI